MEYTGYRQQLKCSEVELFRMIKSSMFKDELDGILHFLKLAVKGYNEFADKRNKDYKENNGLSKVEYPRINFYVKRMDIDSKDKNIANDKSVIVDLNVMYPDGTKSRELDTYKLCGDE